MIHPEPASLDLPDDATQSARLADLERPGAVVPVLTVLWHPDARRLGEQYPLAAAGQAVALNRFTPMFGAAGEVSARPLAHSGVSRTPIHFVANADGSVRLSLPADAQQHELDGQPAAGEIVLERARVERGVVLSLRGRVALCLRHTDALAQPASAARALVGVSGAMVRVRRQVAQAASTELAVLVLGESGTGKELVAQEIHALGARAGRALVAVNMAAMAESLALAELFGSARGAFTGAQAARRGLWAEADGGTLFLDEIGDTPASVQPMMLRAVETGEFRPLGSARAERADVRLVAATDRPLEGGSFNQPLLRRLEGFVIRMPPLRDRREDIGVLLRHLLVVEGEGPAWAADVPAELVRVLCLHDWPGNVRQLGHAVRRLALGARDGLWPSTAELLGLSSGPQARGGEPPAAPEEAGEPLVQEPARRGHRPPSQVSHEALIEALERCEWSLRATAIDLGVSRSSLYNMIERDPRIRWPDAIADDEIEAALLPGTASLAALASRLRTPREALRRRLQAMAPAHAARALLAGGR